MRVIIFTNGLMTGWPAQLTVSRHGDLVIAANGGIAHSLKYGITPHIIVGDMDSVDPSVLRNLPSSVERIKHPSRKNETDFELALRTAMDRKAGEIVVLGALGARWDMTLSNMLILSAGFLSGQSIRFIDGNQEIFALRGPQKIAIDGRPGDNLSLLPLSDTVRGVNLEGLEYPLHDAKLERGTTLGISNVFTGKTARVQLKEGLLLIVIIKEIWN